MTYDPVSTENEAKPITVCAREPLPKWTEKSIFLAGPTPRDSHTSSWRPEALRILGNLGYTGHVFIPEDRAGGFHGDYTDQVEWETAALQMADIIVFWVPRVMANMPALTTNVEWGVWGDSGKVVLGAPNSATGMKYLKWQATQHHVPTYNSLGETLACAVNLVGDGALREGGEAQVPLHIWKHPTFQGWYSNQKVAGNRLDGAQVLWTFRVGTKLQKVFAWAVHVDMYIASEDRHKRNEFVLGRTDIAGVVLYNIDRNHPENVDVVLVREFRSPARTEDGFIVELPTGSIDHGKSPEETAIKELQEETGFVLPPDRLRLVNTRQVAGVLSAHTATIYSAEIDGKELDQVIATMAVVRGENPDEDDGERTTVVVGNLRNLLEGEYDLDWSTLGMICAAVNSGQRHSW